MESTSSLGGRRGVVVHHPQQPSQTMSSTTATTPNQARHHHLHHSSFGGSNKEDPTMFITAQAGGSTNMNNNQCGGGGHGGSVSGIGISGGSIRFNKCPPSPPFPHFPPPPDYPPPQKHIGGGGRVDDRMIGRSKTLHRYPEDPDTIELCLDEPQIVNSKTLMYKSSSSGSSSGHHIEPQIKWSRNNIAATMERFEPSGSSSGASSVSGSGVPLHHQDYSYAYYEPGAAMRHSNIPGPGNCDPHSMAGPSRPPPPNSIRALLSKGNRGANGAMTMNGPITRHTYTTRYGTQENIYEEIGGDGRIRMIAPGQSMISLNQSMVEEEFRRVQNRHRRVLGELNLSVEAMIMPSTPPNEEESGDEEDPPQRASASSVSSSSRHTVHDHNLAELLSAVGPTDELLSPASSQAIGGNDLDSGFSGSSSGASYVGSLRYHRTGSAMSTFPTRSSTPSASGGNCSSIYGGSTRSSQRSHEDPGISSVFLSVTKTLRGQRGSAEDPGPATSSPSSGGSGSTTNTVDPATKSKTSFWNRKGWRKLPGFSSTSSVNKAGTSNDETKLNSGAWEDQLPLPATTTINSGQLINTGNTLNCNTKATRRSDPLSTLSLHNNSQHHGLITNNNHNNIINNNNLNNNHNNNIINNGCNNNNNINNNNSNSNNSINNNNLLHGGHQHHQSQQQLQNHNHNQLNGSGRRRTDLNASIRSNNSEDNWSAEVGGICSLGVGGIGGTSDRELSSDDEDESDRSSATSSTTPTTATPASGTAPSATTQTRNSQLRSTFSKAKHHLSFDKWRSNNNSGNSSATATVSGGSSPSGGSNSSTNSQQAAQVAASASAAATAAATAAAMMAAQQDTTTPGESPGGRLSRWFSIRRGSSHQYDIGGREGHRGNSMDNDELAAALQQHHLYQQQQLLLQQQQQQQSQQQKESLSKSGASNTTTPSGSNNKMPQLEETDETDSLNMVNLRLRSDSNGAILIPNDNLSNTSCISSNNISNNKTQGTGANRLSGTTASTVGVGPINTTASGGSGNINIGLCYRQIAPSLPPAPAGLSQQQLKRRHIIAAIVHSENSYVATLQRLVNDYKKPLEESSPPILSSTKISTLFHRLPEILQCHTLFRIALADSIRNWDTDENIGDVFVGSFSKPIVLDIYSGFINNFSSAMELAKMEAKRKSALADFFKVKQISAHDRLSFFGLMVKPVQRFPQFILFLQDLLKYTPQGHHDRMSLQLALTQLESLAEMLNERKREAEQYQAFKEMIGHISGTFNTRSLSSNDNGNRHRYLLREDNVTQLEFNQSGFIMKSKQRRLLLLNDKVICVSVAPKQSHDFGATEKLTFKWMYPVTDVEIVDNSTSATLSRILTAGLNRGGSLKSNSSNSGGNASGINLNNLSVDSSITNGADNLCNEMSNLMHDYEVMSRINDLVGMLKGYYKDINIDVTKKILTTIQCSIKKKDEEMSWVDSCCLQLIGRNKNGKEETYTFQTDNPSIKKEWITELRLAQLALDTNNSPAWEIPEHEQRPLTKMPLFVKAQPVYKSQHQTEVRCGCYYSINATTTTGLNRQTATKPQRQKVQNYLWLTTSDGASSHIAILSQNQQQSGHLKDITSFDLYETNVTSMEFVRGLNTTNNYDDINDNHTIWMSTDNRKLLIYSAVNPGQTDKLASCTINGVATKILYHLDNVYVALTNGNILIYRRNLTNSNCDINWLLKEPITITLSSLQEPVSSLLPINSNIYAGCGRKVWVLTCNSYNMNATTTNNSELQQQQPLQRSFDIVHGNSNSPVNLMAHSGIGLWVSLKGSSIICLYHTETFKHLQDINIATNVLRVTSSQKECGNNTSSVFVTALTASKGLLWVGTNVGIALTIPLPRLEGVPIISGGVTISYHAHFGPITFLLPLIPRTYHQVTMTTGNNLLAPPTCIAAQQQEDEKESSKNEVVETDTASQQTQKKEQQDEASPSVISLTATNEQNQASQLAQQQQSIIRRRLEKQNSIDAQLGLGGAGGIPAKLRAQLNNSPVVLRRRRYKDATDFSRMSKTLPRSLGSANVGGNNFFSTSIQSSASSSEQGSEQGCCDVYGLYTDLIFVKEDYEETGQGGGGLMDPAYECLRRSDPELAAIPAKVTTLDRRLKMKVSRPRSLDLSNWSVDSRSSSLYTSSGSEESMGLRLFGGRSVSRNSSSASHKTQTNGSDLVNISEHVAVNTPGTNSTVSVEIHAVPSNSNMHPSLTSTPNHPSAQSDAAITTAPTAPITSTIKKKKNSKNIQPTEIGGRRTMITLMGGRGYINWRQVWFNSGGGNSGSSGSGDKQHKSSFSMRAPNSNDAHIVIWEKKL